MNVIDSFEADDLLSSKCCVHLPDYHMLRAFVVEEQRCSCLLLWAKAGVPGCLRLSFLLVYCSSLPFNSLEKHSFSVPDSTSPFLLLDDLSQVAFPSLPLDFLWKLVLTFRTGDLFTALLAYRRSHVTRHWIGPISPSLTSQLVSLINWCPSPVFWQTDSQHKQRLMET